MESLDGLVEYLTQKHAEDQETVANNLVLALFPLWQIMSFEDLDESAILWIQAVLPVIRTAFLQSQRLTAVYVTNVRFASLATEDPFPISAPDVELPQGVSSARFTMPSLSSPLTPSAATSSRAVPGTPSVPSSPFVAVNDPFPEADVATSLAIDGNFNVKAQMPGPEEELMHSGLVNSTGSAVRHAMNGGRSTANNVVRRDRRVIGYARYTDSNPCYFCALLASRGAVYKKGSFSSSDPKFVANKNAPKVPDDFVDIAKVHNHCRCTLRPVYSKSQELDADAAFYRKQWNDFAKNSKTTGKKQIAEWRKVYRPYERTEADVTGLSDALARRHSDLLDAGFAPDSPQAVWAERAQELLA